MQVRPSGNIMYCIGYCGWTGFGVFRRTKEATPLAIMNVVSVGTERQSAGQDPLSGKHQAPWLCLGAVSTT